MSYKLIQSESTLGELGKMTQYLDRILLVTALLLSVPLVAMQFTNEVNWSLGDFAVMGGMLVSTGLLATYAYQRLPFQLKKIAVIAVIAAFVTLWALLAVGL